MSKKSYKLTYFPARGRGEVIRFAFLVAGVEFENCIVEKEQWPELKASGKCPFGQMPILEVKEEGSSKPVVLCQSLAILRYLAREFGLSPESHIDQACADMIVDAAMDIRAKTQKFVFVKDPAEKDKLFKEFQAGLPVDLTNLEKLLKANDGGKGFFVGKKLSYADLGVFSFFNNRLAKDRINGYPEELEKFPLLRGHYERIRDIPAIKKRLESRPVTEL